MFISIKDSKIIAIAEVEWDVRRLTKKLSPSDYWTWIETVTTEDENGFKTYDFSGEDYEIVETNAPFGYETTDDNGKTSFISFSESGHFVSNIEGKFYHLKWDGTKIVKDDTAKAAYDLAEEWKQIRRERTRLLAETDWTQGNDSPLTDAKKTAWATYRTSLRTLPEDQKSKTKYSDITWPTQPS